MNFEDDIFKKRKIDFHRLEEYGFKLIDNCYTYEKNILNNTFLVKVEISNLGIIHSYIYDLAFNEEYLNYRIESQTGKFVSQVRQEFINILEDIKNNCTISCNFHSEQANRITKLIYDKLKNKPEHPFNKDDYSTIFRNQETKKWYALIMNINKAKITREKGNVDILNIKLNPEEIKELLTRNGFYKAYHMNKNNWITIILDDTLTDEEIFKYINKSHEFSNKK